MSYQVDALLPCLYGEAVVFALSIDRIVDLSLSLVSYSSLAGTGAQDPFLKDPGSSIETVLATATKRSRVSLFVFNFLYDPHVD